MGRSAAARGSAGDVRSVRLKDELCRKWKRVIKKLPPAARAAWLNSQEGFVALGVKRCREILRGIEFEKNRRAHVVPSSAWLDSFWGEQLEMPEFLVSHVNDGRKCSVRMKLSRECVRIGIDGAFHRRLTPPQAVGVEDFLDGLERIRAEFYSHPPSPSALAIFRIACFGGEEVARFPGKRVGRAGRWFYGGS